MPEISAKLVNELRAKTGLGMMECKKALTESGGDLQTALDNLKKKGVKASIAERAAGEGRVFGLISDCGRHGALVEINCNTDFTAKSQPIHDLGSKAVHLLLADASANVAENADVKSMAVAASQQTGENVRIGRTKGFSNPEGKIGLYLYTVTHKIGVLTSVTGSPSEELLRDVGMHITAKIPLAMSLDRSSLSPELVAREKQIAVAQAIESGKPPQIAEKIAEGKMRTFYEERVLLDQEFIKPDKFKGSIEQLLKQNQCTLKEYVRLEVGLA